jgi:putative hydrolase of the HAD superfamily
MMNELRWNLVRGVLIDAVGTLLEPVPSVSAAYAEAAHRQQVALDVHLLRDRFRRAFATDEFDDQRGPMTTDEAVERRRWRRIVATCLPEVPDPDRAFAELWDHFALPSSWRPFPDAGPTMARLSEKGVPVLIASNFDSRLRRVLAGLPELAPWADRVAISSEIGLRKPHPGFYLRACEMLNLPPESVLAVGDDPENDLKGPVRAGLQAALVERTGEGLSASLRGLGVLSERIHC